MPFVILVAWRYLTSNLGQTLLLVLGVALSVVIFVFMTALIAGLATYLTAETTSRIAHVEIEAPNTIARVLQPDDRFAAQPVSTVKRKQIRNWQQVVDLASTLDGVVSISPAVDGNGFLVRGEAVEPVALRGLEVDAIDAVAPISANTIEGTADLSAGGLVIGADLAESLSLHAGMPVLLRSDRGRERLIPITGIFRIGLSSLDERVAFLSISAARPLFDLPEGVTSIAIRLTDPASAPQAARILRDATDLKVTPWQERNRSLETALESQGRTGTIIQAFAMIAIVISIASTLLLSTYRRRSEIGIMRAAGIGRGFVATVFVLQGVMIGLAASLIGAALGYRLAMLLGSIQRSDGRVLLPIEPAQGGYVLVITLTVAAAALAAILPARAASRVDPVETIQQ